MPGKKDELFEADPDEPGPTQVVPSRYPPVLHPVESGIETTDQISRSRVPDDLLPPSVDITLTGVSQPRPTLEAPAVPPPPPPVEDTNPGFERPRPPPFRVADIPGPGAMTPVHGLPIQGIPESTQPGVVVRGQLDDDDVPMPSPEPTMVTGRPRPPPPPEPELESEPVPEGIADLPTPVKGQPALQPKVAIGAALLRDRALTWLAVLWCAVLFAAFQPGLLSAESVELLGRGLERGYGNRLPPLLSVIFGELTRLAATPAPLLVIQVALLASGLVALGKSARGGTWGSFAVALLALLVPSVWAVAPTLWGDVWLAGALLWAVVFLDKRRPGLALLALGAAVLVRYHALLAVVPLVVLTVRQLLPRARWFARLPAVLALLVGLSALPFGVQTALRAHRQWPVGRSVVWDLLGVYLERPELYPQSVLAETVPADKLAVLYSPESVDGAFAGAPPAIDPELPTRQRERLEQEWLKVAGQAPGALLHHRMRVLRSLLALKGPVFDPIVEETAANPWGYAPPRSGLLFRKLDPARLALRNSPFFRGITWAAVGLLSALAAVLLRRRAALAFPVVLSGILLLLATWLLGASTDFRFLFWTVVATLTTGLLLARRPTA